MPKKCTRKQHDELEASQPEKWPSLTGLGQVIAWMACVERLIRDVGIEANAVDSHRLKVQAAQRRLDRIREAIEFQPAADSRPGEVNHRSPPSPQHAKDIRRA